MKIAIIGGGWVGCHLACKLKKEHHVTLFDKNDELFKETSYNNQNRLHYGFHYARNFKTRELCKNTFSQFLEEYGFLTEKIEKNFYAVPDTSNIDFSTYLQIFENFQHIISPTKLKNVNEYGIEVEERYINFKLAHKFFNQELTNIFVQENITSKRIKELSSNYDLVINATNNQIRNYISDNFYELTLSLIYNRKMKTDFGALTLVDGNFFSIYPYSDNLFTLTDVEHTPLKKFKKIDSLKIFEKKIDEQFILDKRDLFENKVKFYFPEFSEHFEYESYFLSVKSKLKSSSDERYPQVLKEGNIVNCFTGKIQGIFIIEEMIKKIIKQYA